jgi:hypothetical protein
MSAQRLSARRSAFPIPDLKAMPYSITTRGK